MAPKHLASVFTNRAPSSRCGAVEKERDRHLFCRNLHSKRCLSPLDPHRLIGFHPSRMAFAPAVDGCHCNLLGSTRQLRGGAYCRPQARRLPMKLARLSRFRWRPVVSLGRARPNKELSGPRGELAAAAKSVRRWDSGGYVGSGHLEGGCTSAGWRARCRSWRRGWRRGRGRRLAARRAWRRRTGRAACSLAPRSSRWPGAS